jgi:hypothetical protein
MANEPGFILNESLGGINWGYCKYNKAPKILNINYLATVQTSNLPNSGTTSSVHIILYSDTGTSGSIVLSPSGFQTGAISKVSFTGPHLGLIKKIKIFLQGNLPYRPSSISIISSGGNSLFEFVEKIMPCGISCAVTSEFTGSTPYEISIKTDDSIGSTFSIILISIIGREGFSPLNVFSEHGLIAGSTVKKRITTQDVGEVIGYKLILATSGRWKPVYITILNLSNKKIFHFNLRNVILISPGPQGIYIEIQERDKNQSLPGTEEPEEDENSEDSDTPDLSDPKDPSSSLNRDPNITHDINNPEGGLLDPKEKKNIVELSCTQQLINPDMSMTIFGPDLPTTKTNYINILAKCPSNCYKINADVLGLGIHPMKSPICLSALVDGAMSIYGGIISIGVFPGLKKYMVDPFFRKWKKALNVISFESLSQKSYVISKLDSIDLVSSDVRIVDHQGKLSNLGRLEIRKDGIWGTVCVTGTNFLAARVICKEMGYKYGEWKVGTNNGNTSFSNNTPLSCRNFNNKNYCGASFQKVLYSSLSCSNYDTSYSTCTKKIADMSVCSHEMDAIIECSNENHETGEIISSGVIRLGNQKKIDDEMVGRVEMMTAENFLPICNLGVSWQAINILCKTMGYLEGELVEDPELLKELQLNFDSSISFAAGNISCKGDEANVSQCSFAADVDSCKHDQDLVIKCKKGRGDPSGQSQWKKSIQPKPELGKLPLPDFELTCETLGTNPFFRGDPGSIFIIKCPKLCKKLKGSVWGTGIYSAESFICLAAIHSSLINDETGGSVLLTKTYGQTFYQGSLMNAIQTSDSMNKSAFSFFFSSLNSAVIRMNEKFKENSPPVSTEMYKDFSGKSDFSGINYNPYDINKNHLLSSFLEISSSKVESSQVFKFFPPSIDYKFSSSKNFSLNSHLEQMRIFTIVSSFKMTYFKQSPQYIFSLIGCKGFNIYLNEENILTFGDPCNKEKEWSTDVPLPVDDQIFIYAFYNDGKIKLIVRSEKTKLRVEKVTLTNLFFPGGDSIGLGRLASVPRNTFYGSIDYLFIFNGEITTKSIKSTVNKLIKENQAMRAGLSKNITNDDRICISPCVNSNVPPSEDSGNPPKDSLPDYGIILEDFTIKIDTNKSNNDCKDNTNSKIIINTGLHLQNNSSFDFKRNETTNKVSSYTKFSLLKSLVSNASSTMKNMIDTTSSYFSAIKNNLDTGSNINSKSFSALSPTQIFNSDISSRDPSQSSNLETMDIDCELTLSESKLKGSVGTYFRLRCPKCQNQLSSVALFGTEIFHPRSGICKAAAHLGLLNSSQNEILLYILSGKKVYNGSSGKNDIKSYSFGSSPLSYTIKIAPPLRTIDCLQTADSGIFANAPVFTRYVAKCPSGCANQGEVYGSELYSDSSSICRSAIHYGALTNHGGEIDFMIEGGTSFYKSKLGFGILSKSKEGYIRSFRFLGQKSLITYNYNENFQGKFSDNWLASNKMSGWVYSKIEDYTTGKLRTLFTISNYGTQNSLIKLKNAEWSNGKISFNFIPKLVKKFSVYFRYNNKNNFFAIRFDFNQRNGNIKLISMIDLNFKVLESKSFPLIYGKTYLGKILLDFNLVKFNLQTFGINDTKYIFSSQLDSSLSRGSLAFESDGEIHITGLEISPDTKNSKTEFINNKRSWNQVLVNTSIPRKKRWCNQVFKSHEMERLRCLEDHVYCKMRCDDVIPIVENILNFTCFKECLHKIRLSDISYKPLDLDQKWNPSAGERVDFVLLGESENRPGVILEILKGEQALVSYISDDGEDSKSIVSVRSIFKCGQKLFRRTDC